MPVSVTLKYNKAVTALSVYDRVAHKFVTDSNGKYLYKIDLPATPDVPNPPPNTYSSFTCDQDENDDFDGRIFIEGTWLDGSGAGHTETDLYTLDNASYDLFFPKNKVQIIEEIKAFGSFENMIKEIAEQVPELKPKSK